MKMLEGLKLSINEWQEVEVSTRLKHGFLYYRAAIALAENYPHHCLFIANDNHTFERLSKSGDNERMLRAFLESGLSSAKTRAALNTAEPLRWIE
jgi:hypothetical protein